LTESKISILFKNDQGYEDWVKIWNLYAPIKENFYYYPRISWKTILDNWTDNLIMVLPPFDNFIHWNLLENRNMVPNFGDIKPIVTFFDSILPWNGILNNALKEYANLNSLETIEVNPIYYYKKTDFDAWQAGKCIEKGTKYEKPNLNWCVSNEFCFENYLNRVGKSL